MLGEKPMSLHPNRKDIEAIMYRAWSQGKACEMSTAIKIFNGQLTEADVDTHGFGHGDHYDDGQLPVIREHGDQHADHVDEAHNDHYNHQDFGVEELTYRPHGDEHADHIDLAIENVEHGDHYDETIQNEHNDHIDTEIITIPHGDHTDIQIIEHTDNTIPDIPHGDHHEDLTYS